MCAVVRAAPVQGSGIFAHELAVLLQQLLELLLPVALHEPLPEFVAVLKLNNFSLELYVRSINAVRLLNQYSERNFILIYLFLQALDL